MGYSHGYTLAGDDNDKESYKKYAILQFLLVVAHYTSSIMIIYSDDNDKFTVPWKFQWNSWTPLNATGGSAACSKGCLIGEETYIFTGDERLNVSYIVAAFGLISGSNHLLQLLLYLFSLGDVSTFAAYFENNQIAIIRNVDFAFSAPLMLICSCILFYAPPEAQFLLFVFGFQSLVQLAGAACELIKQKEFKSKSEGQSASLVIFYSAIAFYVLPWAYQITLLYYGGALSDKLPIGFNGTSSALINYPKQLNTVNEALQKAPDVISNIISCTSSQNDPACNVYADIIESIEANDPIAIDDLGPLFGLQDPTALSPEPAPLQVYFFLSWLFVSFGLFPLALFFKLHEPSTSSTENVNFKYEIVYSILSFLSKLPLQYFFFLGSFQRERFAPVTQLGYEPPDDGNFSDRVLENAVIPASICIVLGLITVAVFRKQFDVTRECNGSSIAGVLYAIVAGILLTFTVFIPLFVVMGESQKDAILNPIIGLNLPSVASFAAVAIVGVIELMYRDQS